MFTSDDLFEIAVKMEENGESVYIKAIGEVRNKELKSLLKWMANEEALHARWFVDQQKKLSLEIDETDLKKMVPRVLQDMMGEKTLMLDDVNFNEIPTVHDLLETFIGFETDTIAFYELLKMFIPEESVSAGIELIIQEEKKHIEKLKLMMGSLPNEPN